MKMWLWFPPMIPPHCSSTTGSGLSVQHTPLLLQFPCWCSSFPCSFALPAAFFFLCLSLAVFAPSHGTENSALIFTTDASFFPSFMTSICLNPRSR